MNKELELFYFNILKKEVFSHFREDFSYVPEDTSLWKVMHINYFQEHLFQKTKGNFSDRWFYTYFKNDTNKIPRIDMLNILSEYAGYENWDDFISNHKKEADTHFQSNKPETAETNAEDGETSTSKKKKRKWQYALVGVILILSIVAGLWYDKHSHTYTFYFRDIDRDSLISRIKVNIPSNAAEPIMRADESGKIQFYSRRDNIKLYVESPFYRKDTFDINLKYSDGLEVLELTPNEYIMMVYYYSNSQNTKVEKRRKDLNHLISKDALIYQVYDNENYGQEVLTKEQYINLMTTPTQSLKNFYLISSEEKDGKITRIKFKILSDENSH